MRSLRTIVIVTLAMALSVGMALAQPPQDLSRKMQQANADLDRLAQDLTRLLTHPGFRGAVRSAIAKSKNQENILELDKFLNRAAKSGGMPPGLMKFKDSARKVQGRLKASELTALEGLDLYIPVDAHRAIWKGGVKNLQVAFSPVDDEKDIRQIAAYQVWDGKRVLLDPNRPPQVPVLVIAPCEHISHDMPKSAPNEPQMKAPHDDNPKPDAGRGEKHNSYFSMSYLKIYRDGESWWRGDPEVYLLAGQICGVDDKGYYHPLRRVNDTKKWYYIRDLNRMYFDGNCSWDTFYSVWESDGGIAGVYMWTNHKQVLPTIRCYPAPGDFKYIYCLWRGNGDDEIHAYIPRVHTSKMLGSWYTHNYDSNYSDTRYAAAKFYKWH